MERRQSERRERARGGNLGVDPSAQVPERVSDGDAGAPDEGSGPGEVAVGTATKDPSPGPDETGADAAHPKADLTKRFLAALIDGGLAAVVGWIPLLGGILSGGYMLVRDGLELDFMPRRSIGKKAMGLRPVRLDGRPMDIETSVRRNWPLAVGGIASILLAVPVVGWLLMIPAVLAAMALGITEVVLTVSDDEGRRLGDRTAETVVVESE